MEENLSLGGLILGKSIILFNKIVCCGELILMITLIINSLQFSRLHSYIKLYSKILLVDKNSAAQFKHQAHSNINAYKFNLTNLIICLFV